MSCENTWTSSSWSSPPTCSGDQSHHDGLRLVVQRTNTLFRFSSQARWEAASGSEKWSFCLGERPASSTAAADAAVWRQFAIVSLKTQTVCCVSWDVLSRSGVPNLRSGDRCRSMGVQAYSSIFSMIICIIFNSFHEPRRFSPFVRSLMMRSSFYILSLTSLCLNQGSFTHKVSIRAPPLWILQ